MNPQVSPVASRARRFRPPLLVVLAATGLATVGGLFASPGRSTAAHFALEAAFAGGTGVVAVLALSRHRETGGVSALLVAVGFATLFLQSIVFGIGVPMWDANPWEGSAFPSHGWQVAWLVAAACFAAAGPAARRGRRISEGSAALAAFAALTALDLLLIAFRSSLSHLSDWVLADQAARPFGNTSALHWVLALPAIALLLLAAIDEDRPDPPPRSPRPWLAATYTVACGAQVLFLARPTQYRPIVQAADLFLPLLVGLAFAGLVVASRQHVREMQAEADEAREVREGRAELASVIAHELRNPLMSIKGLATTGARLYDSMSDDERREFFELIDSEAVRLKTTIDDTSTALKIDAGRIRYDLREESLTRIVEETAWGAPHGEHPMTVECEPDLRANVDRQCIAELLLALVDNATKFSPPEAAIEVRAYRRPGDPAVVVEVQDHGPGIAEEQRERIFEKFAAWRPAGYEEVPGAGLGLFICRAHARAHGGSLVVVDGPGNGTMLRLTLPMER